jgi:transcription antitermination factor NusA-like protein
VPLAIFTAQFVEPGGDVVGTLDDKRPARLAASERIASDGAVSQLAVFVLDDVHVSRRSPQLIAELFRQAYPEIGRGDVDVYAVVREPGVRAKVALDWGPDDDDLIQRLFGANDGAVLKQLVATSGDPIIDLVPTAPEPERYIAAAMAPATVERVAIDEEAHRLFLVVPDPEIDPVSIQLASDLTGWDVSVFRASDYRAGGWNGSPAHTVQARNR